MSESWRLEAVVFGGCGVVPAFVHVPSDSLSVRISLKKASALGPTRSCAKGHAQKKHKAWPPPLVSQRKMGVRFATSPQILQTCPSPKVERHGLLQMWHGLLSEHGEDAMN